MIGDAKGEYRGLAYRNDAELQAWLERRPREAALEPELPIIDPHHHFWDTPQRGRYLLPELFAAGSAAFFRALGVDLSKHAVSIYQVETIKAKAASLGGREGGVA